MDFFVNCYICWFYDLKLGNCPSTNSNSKDGEDENIPQTTPLIQRRMNCKGIAIASWCNTLKWHFLARPVVLIVLK